MHRSSLKAQSLPFMMLFLAAGFLMYEFILQVLPGVMSAPFMDYLHLNAFQMGLAASFYYYSYGTMQLFAGAALDRYGPRLTLFIAALLCALGTLCIVMGHHFNALAFGRILTGCGSATAYIGMMFIGRAWFDAKYFYLIVAITGIVACTGAILGEGPVASALNYYSLATILWSLVITGILLGIAIICIVRKNPQRSPSKSHQPSYSLTNILTLFKSPQSWWIGSYAFSNYAPISGFATLWGIPFIHAKYHLPLTSSAYLCSMIWLGIGFGSLSIGYISQRYNVHVKALRFCGLLGLLSALVCIYIQMPLWLLAVMLFCMGVASSGQVLTFNLVAQHHPANRLGTALGFNNFLTVIAGAVLQPAIGFILTHSAHSSSTSLSAVQFEWALSLIPLCYAISFLISRFKIKAGPVAKKA